MNNDIVPRDIVVDDVQEAVLRIQGNYDPQQLQIARINQKKGVYRVKDVAQYIIKESLRNPFSCCTPHGEDNGLLIALIIVVFSGLFFNQLQ